MQLLNSPVPVSDYDVELIRTLINEFAEELTGAELCQKFEDLFDDELTAGHYIVFGFLLGEVVAARTATENVYNQISNVCLRQN